MDNNVNSGRVGVTVAGVVMMEGEFGGGVEEDFVTWTLEGGKLAVMMHKVEVWEAWEGLYKRGGGKKKMDQKMFSFLT